MYSQSCECADFSRKMRLVVDMIRGMEVFRALGVLKFSNKEAAARVEKLLRSAIAIGNRKMNVKQKLESCAYLQSA